MSINNPENGVLSWRNHAQQRQLTFYQTYGNGTWWSGNPNLQQIQLERKIGSILFRYPQTEEQSEPDLSSYYTRDIITIKNVVKKISQSFNGVISIAIILICIQLKTEEDLIVNYVFRIWNTEKQIYIDSTSKIYEKWSKFVQYNKLPSCSFCYPESGRYQVNELGELQLEFGDTTVQNYCRRLLKFIDIIFIIIALLGLILGIISQVHDNAFDNRTEKILTIIAVSLIASAGLYNLLRCLFVSHSIFKY